MSKMWGENTAIKVNIDKADISKTIIKLISQLSFIVNPHHFYFFYTYPKKRIKYKTIILKIKISNQ